MPALPQKSKFHNSALPAVVRHGSALPSSSDMVLGFASEWFQLKKLEGIAPNEIYPRTRQGRAMPHNSWQSRIMELGTGTDTEEQSPKTKDRSNNNGIRWCFWIVPDDTLLSG